MPRIPVVPARWAVLIVLMILGALALGWPGSAESVPDVDGIEVELNSASFTKEVLLDEGFVLVEFGADWCEPCHTMKPILAYLSEQYEGRLKVGTIDVDDDPALANEFDALGILPMFVMFRAGEVVGLGRGGVSYRILSEWVNDHLARGSSQTGN